MPAVRSVTLAGFRGAPIPLTVDFRGRNHAASSLLLIGDNGTGKSTIVDAIEFCLQARVGRLAGFNDETLPRIANYAALSYPDVRIEFDDGSIARRTADSDEGRIIVCDRAIHDGFRLAPVSIKRSDLLRFSSAARTARLVQLLDYLADRNAHVEADMEGDFPLLEEARRAAKDARRHAVARLATKMQVAPEAIPLEIAEFNAFVQRYGRVPGPDNRRQVRSNVTAQVRPLMYRLQPVTGGPPDPARRNR